MKAKNTPVDDERSNPMKLLRFVTFLALGLLLITISYGCAGRNYDRYNTQRGAVIGAGVGALAGQAIGHNTEGTLIGAAVGTLLGAIAGNAVDQEYAASREAALTNKRIVYYDTHDRAIEAVPGPVDQSTKCRKVTKREWDGGRLVRETVEEICEGQKQSQTY
jgi:hypothetical protein